MTMDTPALALGGSGPTNEPRPLAKGTVARLLRWIIPANLSIYIIWGAVPGVLLPLQIQGIDPANKVANLAVVATIGAFAAMLAQPIAGTVSDRTRTRFGRRAPWMVMGVLIGGLSLVGMALANTLIQVAIAWVIVQIAYNFTQGPLSAILPDRVPRAARGTFSAMAGLGAMLGALGGQVAGAALSSAIPTAYVLLAGLALVAIPLFVVFNPDHSSEDEPLQPFNLADFLRTFWVNPVAHPDFFWAFTGRLLLYLGYFAITGYQLYILQEYIGLGDRAVTYIPLFGVITLAGIIVDGRLRSAVRPPRTTQDLRLLVIGLGRRGPCRSGVSAHGDRLGDLLGGLRHRLRDVLGGRPGADERGAAVGDVLRQGPRGRQHRRDPPADARTGDRGGRRPTLRRVRRTVPGGHRAVGAGRLRGVAHQGGALMSTDETSSRLVGPSSDRGIS